MCVRLAELMGIKHFSMATLVTHAGKHRREFWQLLVLELLQIEFTKRPLMVLDVVDDDPEEARYCSGARLNIADSCFRHKNRDAPAVVYGTDESQLSSISFKQLETYTNRVANAIVQRLDLQCGDAVAILMPMTLQAVVISLALVKAGMAVVGIAESFSAAEIAVRLQLSQSKALFTYVFGVALHASLLSDGAGVASCVAVNASYLYTRGRLRPTRPPLLSYTATL